MLGRRDDRHAPRHDEVGVLKQLEPLERVASHADEIGGSAFDELPEWRQPEMFPCSRRGGRQHVERREGPIAGLEHEEQFLGVDAPGDIGMGEIGAVEQPYPCFDEPVGVIDDTRAMGLAIERADDPHARSRRASDQVIWKRVTENVGPLVNACLERNPGSLRPTEMGGDDEPMRVSLLDNRPDHFKREDRPGCRGGGLMPMVSAGPGSARRPARLQSNLDERRATGSVLGDRSASRLNIGDFAGNVVTTEDRDWIATGCGEDRSGAQYAQTSIAARGPRKRAARVPHSREAVTQEGFLRGLVEEQMGVQVDEAGKEGAGKVDELPGAAKAVDRCHGLDPITRDGDCVALEHARAVEHALGGYDVSLAGRAMSEARWLCIVHNNVPFFLIELREETTGRSILACQLSGATMHERAVRSAT